MKTNKEYKIPSIRIIELKPTEIIAGSPEMDPDDPAGLPGNDPEPEPGSEPGT